MSFIVLHTGQTITLVEYVIRLFVYLVSITGIGVSMYWVVRVTEIVYAEISGDRGSNDTKS